MEDMRLEGELMQHCGKEHQFWVHKGIEVFFSLRNEFRVPKSTIYFKPVEYLGKRQPEDDNVRFGRVIEGMFCGTRSTAYEFTTTVKYPNITWEGRELRLISVSGRFGSDELSAVSRSERVKAWLLSLGADAASVNLAVGEHRW